MWKICPHLLYENRIILAGWAKADRGGGGAFPGKLTSRFVPGDLRLNQPVCSLLSKYSFAVIVIVMGVFGLESSS